MHEHYIFGKSKCEEGPKSSPPARGTNVETLIKEPSFMEDVSNRIYFYAEIDREKVLMLNKKLYEMELSHLRSKDSLGLECDIPIFLNINSYGGSIFAGLSAMDQILNIKVPLVTTVDGCCASAATFLSVVGSKRLMKRNAYMLIHQLSSGTWGTYSQVCDEKENLDRFMTDIKRIYKEHTKVPMKKLDEILKHDLWWDAQQCLDYGLIDQIIS